MSANPRLLHTQTEITHNPYGYTGREFDLDDLYYYRARYYDPIIQRFLSADPIEFEAGDVNFYRYVGNDPVNFVDLSGLDACKCGSVTELLNLSTSKKVVINGAIINQEVDLIKIQINVIYLWKRAYKHQDMRFLI